MDSIGESNRIPLSILVHKLIDHVLSDLFEELKFIFRNERAIVFIFTNQASLSKIVLLSIKYA